jgi:RNA polymerase sigma-70 factor, ECF subfamily
MRRAQFVTGTYPNRVTQARVTPGDGQSIEESRQIERLRAGDAAEYERFVREQSPRLLSVIRRYLAEEADALDALQDAWLSAFRALPAFAGDSKLSTWLHRIAINAALMKLRSQRRRREAVGLDESPGIDDARHHARLDWSDSAASLEDEEARLLVRSCIDRLPEAFRTVILLRDIEGFDTEGTAQLLGLSGGATKAKLHRARQALRDLVEEEMLRRQDRPEAKMGSGQGKSS